MTAIEWFVNSALQGHGLSMRCAPPQTVKVVREVQHKPTKCPGIYLHSSNKNRGEAYYLVRAYDEAGHRVAVYDGPDFFEACCIKKTTKDRRLKKV